MRPIGDENAVARQQPQDRFYFGSVFSELAFDLKYDTLNTSPELVFDSQRSSPAILVGPTNEVVSRTHGCLDAKYNLSFRGRANSPARERAHLARRPARPRFSHPSHLNRSRPRRRGDRDVHRRTRIALARSFGRGHFICKSEHNNRALQLNDRSKTPLCLAQAPQHTKTALQHHSIV
jgi:hypothetical protein